MSRFFQYTTEQIVYGSSQQEPAKKPPLRSVSCEVPAEAMSAPSEIGERIVDNMVRSFDSIRNARIVSERSNYVPPELGGDPFATP